MLLFGIITAAGIWLFPLFYGIFRDNYQILWINILCSVIFAVISLTVIFWSMFALISAIIGTESSFPANQYVIVFSVYLALSGIFYLILLVEIVIVRKYQAQLREREMNDRDGVSSEVHNMI